MAKLAARAQLMGDAPVAAVAVLEPLVHLLDDEGQRLLAAALARAERPWDAVRVYRALIVAAPDDATVWMGLALALDATGTDRTAVVYAYQQARALSHDARLSRLAELRLAALA